MLTYSIEININRFKINEKYKLINPRHSYVLAQSSCLKHTSWVNKCFLLTSKRKNLHTRIIKLKFQEIIKEKPNVCIPGASDTLDRERYHCDYQSIHYHLNKIKNDNYFSLASNIFLFCISILLRKIEGTCSRHWIYCQKIRLKNSGISFLCWCCLEGKLEIYTSHFIYRWHFL